MTKENWKDIHEDFKYYHYQKNWETSFTYQETRQWIDIGLTLEEYAFALIYQDKKVMNLLI